MISFEDAQSIKAKNVIPMPTPVPIIPFDQPQILTEDELNSLRIESIKINQSQFVGLSGLPEYQDSFFHFEMDQTGSWSLMRKVLDPRPEAERAATPTDYSSLLKWFADLPGSFPVLPFNSACILSKNQLDSYKLRLLSPAVVKYPDPDGPSCSIRSSELPLFEDSVFEIYQFAIHTFLVVRRPSGIHFSIDDIRKIGDKILGLRHLSTPAQARWEAQSGLYGDSINLSFGEAELGTINPYFQLHTKKNHEIKKLLPSYERGIESFIEKSLISEMNKSFYFDGPGCLDGLVYTAKKTRFLVLEYDLGTSFAYGPNSGDSYGFFPKMHVPPEKISTLPPPDIDAMKLSDAYMPMKESEAYYQKSFNRIVTLFKRSLLDHLRGLKV